ncbi:NADH:flavin oxidoreductase/NADH oxidase [Paenarthrobacter sp. NPDC090520]|uniref:NADH:flavin oxidoreductase/NADH oxidase n=1 Tax=unclassified Paenarthrobacter TaxID=2634190 RepID=UPI0038024ABB
MADIFDPVTFRGLTIPNRAWMSPMCTYSADAEGDRIGRPHDFHLGHYASRAAGGVGLVMIEATGVVPEGRITPFDLGLWSEEQVGDFARLVNIIGQGGAVPGIQLAHAGRKASTDRPWLGGEPLGEAEGGWQPLGPSAVEFPGNPVPAQLTRAQISDVVDSFARSARLALRAGFEVVEVHAAHGYLLHSFLSPISNQRGDEYGGSLENRARLVLEVIDAVRKEWPEDRPVFLRVSSTDWVSEDPNDHRSGWSVEDTVQLTKWAHEHGIDLVDCSSGGLIPARIPNTRDYQVSNAARVQSETHVPVAAVGRVADPAWARELVASEAVEAIFLGRALLRDPSWVNNAATALDARPRFIEQYDFALTPA